tara:strand:+ start:5970 stop:6860 length:891 start_codon:yes stop_codon:yes gene_type:complete
LLSISQTSRGFFCIEWISTEQGPKIINLEHLKSDIDFSNKNDLESILELYKSNVKSDSKSLSIILNSNKLLTSKIEVLDSLDRNNDIIDWHESNILGKEFCNNYYNYYFPVYSDNLYNYLCVYLPRKIKDNIINSSFSLGYEMRYLSIDIFSAALGARQVFYNEINSEYLIWKICNKNLHRLVLYNGNKLNAYIEIYKKNNQFISKKYIGSKENESLLINCVNEILINKSNFHRFNNIYVYQTKQNKSDINRIIDLNFKNIKILNFNKMIDSTKEYNPLKYISYVENGIVFKGIDI